MSFVHVQEGFEGPLDLLLELIEAEQLDITTISLAEVTDQYLARVERLEEEQLPQISDFLVVAARLILLKSRALLPDEPEEAEPDELTAQLAEYKLIKELAAGLEEKLADSALSLEHPPTPPTRSEALFVGDGVSLPDLQNAFTTVLERLPDESTLPEQALAEHITIEECIAAVRAKLTKGPTAFTALFGALKTRLAMIVTFLAVLELIKQRLLAIGRGPELLVSLRA
jgi:segregation and condensation protein A